MKDKKEKRKQRFAEMEQKLKEIYPREEDRMFYYHSSDAGREVDEELCRGGWFYQKEPSQSFEVSY